MEAESLPTFHALSIQQQYQKINWILSPITKFCTINNFKSYFLCDLTKTYLSSTYSDSLKQSSTNLNNYIFDYML